MKTGPGGPALLPARPLLLDGRHGRPSDLPALVGSHAAHADTADDLPADDDRQPAGDRRGALQAEDRVAALGDAFLERAARPAELRRGLRLVDRDPGARDLGVVHPLEVDEVAVV